MRSAQARGSTKQRIFEQHIAAGTAPAYLVYEDETSVAFLDLAPLRQGHTLVIPRTHVPDVMSDGGGQALIDIGPAIHHVSQRLMEVFSADGINLLQANKAMSEARSSPWRTSKSFSTAGRANLFQGQTS